MELFENNAKSSRVSKTTLLLLETEGAFGIVTQGDGGSNKLATVGGGISHKRTATAYLQSHGKDS